MSDVGRIFGRDASRQQSSSSGAVVPAARIPSNVARRIKLATRYLPTKDPYQAALYYKLAADPRFQDDTQYMDAVAQAGGFLNAQKKARFFMNLSRSSSGPELDAAVDLWDGLKPRARSFLLAMGVRSPEEYREARQRRGDDGSVFGDVLGVVAWPFKAAAKGAGETVGRVLDWTNRPLEAVKWADRVGSIATARTGNPLQWAFTGGILGKPEGGWDKADISLDAFWEDLKYGLDVAGEGKGEKAITYPTRQRALDMLDGDKQLLDDVLETLVTETPNQTAYAIATRKMKARGLTPEKNPEDWQRIYGEADRFVKSDKFIKTYTFLQARQISFGRNVARGFGLNKTNTVDGGSGFEDAIYDVVSGFGDATYSIVADPTLMAGRVFKAARIGYGVARGVAVGREAVEGATAIGRTVSRARNAATAVRAAIAAEEAGPWAGRVRETLRADGVWREAVEGATRTDIVRMADDAAYRAEAHAEWRALGMNDEEVWATEHVLTARADTPEAWRAYGALHQKQPKFQAVFARNHRNLQQPYNLMLPIDLEIDDAVRAAANGAGSADEIARAQMIIDEAMRQKIGLRNSGGLGDIDNFVDFIDRGEGGRAILTGYTSRATNPATQFPVINERMVQLHGQKMRFEGVLDAWQRAGGAAQYQDTPLFSRLITRGKSNAAKTVRMLTQQLPTTMVFSVMDDAAGLEFQRFMRTALPFDETYRLYGDFLAAANSGGRREIIRDGINKVLNAYGLDDTDLARQWRFATDARSQAYATAREIDGFVPPGTDLTVPVALWKGQLADDMMAMPSFRDMMRALPKIGTYRHTMGAINSQLMDTALNRFWKPMVILRLGFIPRAAGEETLAMLAREPVRLLKAWTLYPLHTPAAMDGQLSTPFRLLGRLERRLRHFNYFDEYKRIWRVRDALRRGAYDSITEEDLALLIQKVGVGRAIDHEALADLRQRYPSLAQQADDELMQNRPWYGRSYKEPKRCKIRLGGSSSVIGFENTPFFMFDPRDVQWTLKLENMARNMTRGLLSTGEHMALRSIIDHPAVYNAHARGIVGSDTFLWETPAEWGRGPRGEVEIGHSPVPGARPIPMIVDRSRYTVTTNFDVAQDPVVAFALDSMLNSASIDRGLRNAANPIMGYIDDLTYTQLDSALNNMTVIPAERGVPVQVEVDDVRAAVRNAASRDRQMLELFDELTTVRSGYSTRAAGVQYPDEAAVDAVDDGLRDQIRRRITDMRDDATMARRAEDGYALVRDANTFERVLDVWDTLDAEARGALLFNESRIVGAPGPGLDIQGVVPVGDTGYIRKRDLYQRMTDRRLPQAQREMARDDLLEIIVREDLLSEGNLWQYQRSAGAGGRAIADPPKEGLTRIWFPMMDASVADNAAQRLAQSRSTYDQQLLASYRRRVSPDAVRPDEVMTGLVPFGFWGHADAREAGRVAAALADNQAYTIGYVDVPSDVAKAYYRGPEDAPNLFPRIGDAHFEAGNFRVAEGIDELVPIGPGERAMARGRTYHPDRQRLVETFSYPDRDAAMATMRSDADGAIVELTDPTVDSEALRSWRTVGDVDENSRAVLLQRQETRRGRPIDEYMRMSIDDMHAQGATFIVGDVPGLDDHIIRYLDDIDASYVVLHAGEEPRILVRRGTNAPAPGPDDVPQFGVGSSYNEMIDEWVAKRVAAAKERFLHRESGRPLYGVGRPIANGTYRTEHMYQSGVSLPWAVVGPARRPVVRNLYDDFVRWGFDSVISPAIDTIIRRPMYLASAAKAYEEVLRTVGPQLLPDQAAIRGVMARFTTPEGVPLFDNVDEFYSAVAPTLRWARDNGFNLKSITDLEQLLRRKAADLQTVGLEDIGNRGRNILFDRVQRSEYLVPNRDTVPTIDLFGDPYRRTGITVENGGADLDAAVRRGLIAQEVDIIDEDVATMWKWFLSEDDARNQMAKIAHGRAFEDNIRFIDDHRIKSQFAENVRNLVPFYFAEEQFLKRWVRTIAYDPAGIRRVQLLKHGLDSIGFTKTDPQTGESYFVYPFSEQLNGLLGRVSQAIFGKDTVLPISVPMTGQVRYSMPGLDNRGMPQVGPLVAVPLSQLAHRLPELKDVEYAVLGERNASRGLFEQLVPTSIKRFVDAYSAKPETSAEMASTMISVIQIMEAEGLSPSDTATEDEVETYLDRVENWTRTLMYTKAVLGFVAPAPPSGEIDGKELSLEFRELLRDLPIDEALATFMRTNPDATPFTVFRTRTPSGAVIPTGKKTLDWLQSNNDLLADYPLGAPWIIPQENADDEFSAQAYNQQIALGVRERRLPAEMYAEIKFAKSAPTYFDTKDAYSEQISMARNLGDVNKARVLEAEYGRWRTSFLAQNPVFSRELQSPDSKIRRQTIVTQLTDLIDDPRAKRRVDPAVREVLNEYQIFQAQVEMLRFDRSSVASEQRAALRKNLFNWLEQYTRKNASARALYLRVIRPELNIDESNVGTI